MIENQSDWIETYYSNEIYPIIGIFLRFLFGWIPFSLGDVLLFFVLFKIILFIFDLFRTKFKNPWHQFFRITSFVSILYFAFYFLWGLNYFRISLSKKLELPEFNYSTEQLVELSDYLIKNLNIAHLEISNIDSVIPVIPYSQKEIYDLSVDGFDNLSLVYSEFGYYNVSVKSSLMSLLQSYNGTSGYFNPFTGEAQVNDKVPKTSYPTTTCHEIAHQLGFAAENEANFIGFLATLKNPDKYFQYSAYRMATRYVIFELYKRDIDLYKNQIIKINKGVLKDFNKSAAFWKQYENPFEPIFKKGYNAYLKANKQSKGIQSYNYVVNLFISYYKKLGVLKS